MREKNDLKSEQKIHKLAMAFDQPAMMRAIQYILGVDVNLKSKVTFFSIRRNYYLLFLFLGTLWLMERPEN